VIVVSASTSAQGSLCLVKAVAKCGFLKAIEFSNAPHFFETDHNIDTTTTTNQYDVIRRLSHHHCIMALSSGDGSFVFTIKGAITFLVLTLNFFRKPALKTYSQPQKLP